ncbi:membrane hypothetical protein [uncultured Defluviicoccus sp.]|uniref:PAS domain-containing protein n=1 Tax=metagenome TaxID=256318 RepID=A0A380T9D6_9ZZZZ|nr:membrane hypothetical protein [uncultured Defluviicoccus sp.]
MAGQGGMWLRALAVGAGYGAVAFLCLSLSRFGAPVESIWLPNAVLVAALVSMPRKAWPALIGAAALGHVAAHLATGDALDFTLAFLVGDMIECLLCAFLLTPQILSVATWKHVFRFLVVCGLVGPLVSASIAAAGSLLIGRPMAPQDFAMWFGADALGLIFLLPLIHAFTRARREALKTKPLRLLAAVAAVVGLSILAAWLVYIPTLRLLLLPVFVMVAFELGVGGAAISLATLMIMWTTMTIMGHSPVPWLELSQRDYMLITQVFLAVFSGTVLPLAVTLEQKQRLSDTLAGALKETQEAWGAIIASEARYQLVVDNVAEKVMRVAPDGLILFCSPACASFLEGQEFEGRNLFDLMHPEDSARERERFALCISRGLTNLANRWAWRMRANNGAWMEIDGRVTLVSPGGPGEREFVVVLRAAA